MVAQQGHTARWDAMIGRIGVVSHHLRSLLGAIRFNRFACLCMRGRIFLMFRLGRLYCTSRVFDLLASSKKCNQLFTRNKITKQRAFHIVSFSPSLKNVAQNFKPLGLAESPYFHSYGIFTLDKSTIYHYNIFSIHNYLGPS